MQDWYLIRKPPVYLSGYETEDFDFYAADGFDELANSFLGADIILYDENLHQIYEGRGIIQNRTADSYTNSVNRQILVSNTLGNRVHYVYDKNEDVYWLVNAAVSRNGFYSKLIAWYCKYRLRFISPVSGEVVEYPIYTINSTQYNSGETDGQKITVGSAQHLIYLPYNEETALIDNGVRFLLDKRTTIPTAYRLTQVDSTSYGFQEQSVLQWTVLEDQFSPLTDNKELMVADYYNANVGYELTIDNVGSEISLGVGSEFQILVSAYRNETRIEPVGVVWSSSAESVAQVSQSGKISALSEGEAVIAATYRTIQKSFTVLVGGSSDVYSVSCEGFDSEPTILYGTTELLRFVVNHNGVPDESVSLTFTLEQADSIAEIVSQDGNQLQLSVADRKENVGKSFLLVCESTSPAVRQTIKIEVGGFW